MVAGLSGIASCPLSVYAWQNLHEAPLESGLHFFVSPSLSMYYGTVYEYVFDGGQKISELDWDVKPLICAGLNVSAYYDNFSLLGNYSQAVNEKTGKIEDFDWDANGVFTNYSSHDETQNGSVFYNLAFGYSLPLKDFFSIGMFAGWRYADLQFSAQNGYLEYPPGSARQIVYGTGIIYEQKYSIPYLGIKMSIIFPFFEILGILNYSRWGSCEDKDSHIKRGLDFYDSIKDFEYFNAGCSINVPISERLKANAGINANYIPMSKGSSYVIDVATGTRTVSIADTSGIEMRMLDLQVCITAVY